MTQPDTQSNWAQAPLTLGPNHRISDTGEVRSIDRTVQTTTGERFYRGRVMAARVAGRRVIVQLSTGVHARVEDAVMEAFGPPRPAGHVLGYRDNNPGNVAASNLVWKPGSRPGHFALLSADATEAYEAAIRPALDRHAVAADRAFGVDTYADYVQARLTALAELAEAKAAVLDGLVPFDRDLARKMLGV